MVLVVLEQTAIYYYYFRFTLHVRIVDAFRRCDT